MGWLWAMSIPGIVCLLVVLAALERFGLWGGRRSWLPGRGDRTRSSISGVGIEEFGAFFYAGKRDELEHRKSELVLPESETSGDPPEISVDPETGETVYRPRRASTTG
ncbi:hypothetical protein BLA60_31500 [Actinophytocola xinjiangensis]|uniref:Uncharacterized protein n=1 Tax=Actinophytocola xinjiangensis TaxID=485602 RepID=A0A7Z0WHR9_9PSEU|nr:DUF6191 domain-containing protein [Actinophytocola xinjiangensis]OLF06494.1 hypothetical protein BLA60_31500 [Actinophytocola xinjiangensis]